jgi:2-phosphosulfolactate phosphatase
MENRDSPQTMSHNPPELYTSFSPALLDLYDVHSSIVVIIDVLRATSTIATALFNGAKCVIPVDSVAKCIELGRQIDGITAGERDGRVAEGLEHGNSPFEYPKSFINGKTLVLTTTNGTKQLHMALEKGAQQIVTGAFSNLDVVCRYLQAKRQNVIMGCSAWKDRINMEDTLLAGAIVHQLGKSFMVNCDSSKIAECLYMEAKDDLYEFLHRKNASHFHRLSGYGLQEDIRYCLTPNVASVLPLYSEGKLMSDLTIY